MIVFHRCSICASQDHQNALVDANFNFSSVSKRIEMEVEELDMVDLAVPGDDGTPIDLSVQESALLLLSSKV